MNRRRECFGVSALVLMSVLSIPLLATDTAAGSTLYVGGPGNYTTIQEAIDNATSGDTVFVNSGTYFGGVVINKTINLVGEGRDTTHILGTGTSRGVKVTANWVNFSGLMVTGSSLAVGLELWGASNCTISASYFSVGYARVISLVGAHGNSIKDSVLTSSPKGIVLESSNENTISGNNISDIDSDGIWLQSSSMNILTANSVHSNGGDGIRLEDSSSNEITNNSLTDNQDGIFLLSSSGNALVHNNLVRNSGEGIEILFPSIGNSVHHNLFFENNKNALDDSSNEWDDGAEGNYWDDYGGSDLDNDTIGDSAYHIPGGGCLDDFPMMLALAELEGSTTVTAGEGIDFGNYDRTYDMGTVQKKSWDFDDSDGIQEDAVGDGPTYAYATGGSKTVTLTVVNERGWLSTDTMSVFVIDEILFSIAEDAGDVVNEDGQVVGGHSDIDIVNVTMWLVGEDIIVKITVAGTIKAGVSGSDLYSYGVFFYLDEDDDISDPDYADYTLIWNSERAELWDESTGMPHLVDAWGKWTPTMTAKIPLSYLEYRTDFRFDAVCAYYVGYSEYTGTWDEAFLDYTSEDDASSPFDIMLTALFIGGLIFLPIVLRLYLRSRKKKKKPTMTAPGSGGEVVYYGHVDEGGETSEPPRSEPAGRPPTRPP
jgi:parallel beta-helix repeat protein